MMKDELNDICFVNFGELWILVMKNSMNMLEDARFSRFQNVLIRLVVNLHVIRVCTPCIHS